MRINVCEIGSNMEGADYNKEVANNIRESFRIFVSCLHWYKAPALFKPLSKLLTSCGCCFTFYLPDISIYEHLLKHL